MPVLPLLTTLLAPTLPPVAHLRAAHTDTAPVLDGRLDDAVWRLAPASEAFTQKQPRGGERPVERTTVRVLYDREALYVGVTCEQTLAPVVARLTRRNRSVEANWVSIMLGTRGDGKSAFEFNVNAAGVLTDGIHYNDTDYSTDWDENWDAKTAKTDRGWTAEFMIPLRILRFETADEQSFAFEVRRYVSNRQEIDEWAFIPREAGGEVSHYGRLDGLLGLRRGAPLELAPFVVGTVRHYDAHADTLARGFTFVPSAGLDLKWHVTQRLTLDGTINPDFGQVEADQVVLNLSNFETFYPEKRPFFLEGIDTFSTPLPLLYTRRIGLAPPAPALRTGRRFDEQLYDEPQPAPIYAATKLTGDLGAGVSVAEIFALTAQQNAPVVLGDGTRVDRVAEPLTAFKVLRLKKDLGSGAFVGLFATATSRVESTDSYPPVAPAQSTQVLCPSDVTVARGARCFHDAYVGAVDGRWRSEGGDYVVFGQAAGTLINNGPPEAQLDGTLIQSGDLAPAALVSVAKEGGAHWVWNLEYDYHGQKTDYNDLGYMQRQNQHNAVGGLEYRTLDPAGPTLETHTRLEAYDKENLRLVNLARSVQVNNYTKYKNFWSTWAEAFFRPAYFDDREVGDGAALERSGVGGFELGVWSDSRMRVHGGLWTEAEFRPSGFLSQGSGDFFVDVLPQFDVELLPQWLYSVGEPRYFLTQGADYLFGRQRAQNVSLTLRATYTFTPRLSLQAYAQLFAAAEHYGDLSSFAVGPTPPATLIPIGELRPFGGAPATSPDFEEGVINASIVFRWEYRLGSTIYVVYTHAQDTLVTTDLVTQPAQFDLHLAQPRVAADAVLVKASYWWAP